MNFVSRNASLDDTTTQEMRLRLVFKRSKSQSVADETREWRGTFCVVNSKHFFREFSRPPLRLSLLLQVQKQNLQLLATQRWSHEVRLEVGRKDNETPPRRGAVVV